MSESPPPTIVQLREIIRAVRDREGVPDPREFTPLDASSLLVAMNLCDWLVQQHPSLTAGFFLRRDDDNDVDG